MTEAKNLGAPYELVRWVAQAGKLPVPNFSAGGIATPADAALMMQLGAEAVFVGSGIFKSNDPEKRAKAIVQATTHFKDADVLVRVSEDLGDAWSESKLEAAEKDLMQTRAGSGRHADATDRLRIANRFTLHARALRAGAGRWRCADRELVGSAGSSSRRREHDAPEAHGRMGIRPALRISRRRQDESLEMCGLICARASRARGSSRSGSATSTSSATPMGVSAVVRGSRHGHARAGTGRRAVVHPGARIRRTGAAGVETLARHGGVSR